jgi:uncharacterized protein YcbK (DUF882 family)
MVLQRREFLGRTTACAVAALAGVQPVFALTAHRIAFYHLHTGESLKLEYADAAAERAEVLAELSHFLRDFRTKEIHPIDPGLLAILDNLYGLADRRGHFEIISGYRSPRTNEGLRAAGGGVAKDSLHIHGRAVDVRLTSMPTASLYRAAAALGRGGAGFYPKSDFVHLDTGRVRTW